MAEGFAVVCEARWHCNGAQFGCVVQPFRNSPFSPSCASRGYPLKNNRVRGSEIYKCIGNHWTGWRADSHFAIHTINGILEDKTSVRETLGTSGDRAAASLCDWTRNCMDIPSQVYRRPSRAYGTSHRSVIPPMQYVTKTKPAIPSTWSSNDNPFEHFPLDTTSIVRNQGFSVC